MHIYSHIKNIMDAEKAPHTVLEIGAHIGNDTVRILKNSEPCKYFAFEPDPTSYKIFERLPIIDKVQLAKCAVGDYDGTIIFNQCDCTHPVNKTRFTGASSILEPSDILLKKHAWIKMEKSITVPICTLDTFTKSHNLQQVTFIWCDAQGAEGKIIQGAVETLKRTKYFYFEYFEQEMYTGCMVLDEILELLPNWEIVERYVGDILLKNTKI